MKAYSLIRPARSSDNELAAKQPAQSVLGGEARLETGDTENGLNQHQLLLAEFCSELEEVVRICRNIFITEIKYA